MRRALLARLIQQAFREDRLVVQELDDLRRERGRAIQRDMILISYLGQEWLPSHVHLENLATTHKPLVKTTEPGNAARCTGARFFRGAATVHREPAVLARIEETNKVAIADISLSTRPKYSEYLSPTPSKTEVQNYCLHQK